MDFKKEEHDEIIKAICSVTTTFAIFSEPDESEDETTQLIRKKLREFTDSLFDLQDEVKQFLQPYQHDLAK